MPPYVPRAAPTWRAEEAWPAGLTTGRPSSEQIHGSGTVRGEPRCPRRPCPPLPGRHPAWPAGGKGGERPCRHPSGSRWRGPHLTWTWQNRVAAPRGGWCRVPPINSTLRGLPPPTVGPSSCPGTASWALKSCPGSSGAGPGPSPHPTTLCSGSRQPDFWEDWGRAPKPQPSPACRSPQRCKEAPRTEPPRCTLCLPQGPRAEHTALRGAAGRPARPVLQPRLTQPTPPAPPPAPGQAAQGCRQGRGAGRTGGSAQPQPLCCPASLW